MSVSGLRLYGDRSVVCPGQQCRSLLGLYEVSIGSLEGLYGFFCDCVLKVWKE